MQVVHKNLHILGLLILSVTVLRLPVSLSSLFHKVTYNSLGPEEEK